VANKGKIMADTSSLRADWQDAAQAKAWLASLVRPLLESLHSCFVKWGGNVAHNTTVEVPSITQLSPKDNARQLSVIQQYVIEIRDWALRKGLHGLPPAPSAFSDREQAQSTFSEWCAYLEHLSDEALRANSRLPSGKPEQGEGEGGAALTPGQASSVGSPTAGWLAALKTVRDELDSWGDFEQSESWEEHFPEAITNDKTPGVEPHPLWLAVVVLQRFYPKNRLPKPTGALDAWANLCEYSRQYGDDDPIAQRDKAIEAAGKLREWVCGEIERLKSAGTSTRGDSDLDRRFMETAIEEARKCKAEDGRVHPKVGVVVVKDGIVLAKAYRGELGEGDHAEYTALEKKLPDAAIAGATVYTTLEPCTSRNHPKISCAGRLIERRVKRVVIGMPDPNPTVHGEGWARLQEANIVVDGFDSDLKAQIEEMNREFIRYHKNAPEGSATSSSAKHGGRTGDAGGL
jgi:pyrimidine deaminase RibD-like protein